MQGAHWMRPAKTITNKQKEKDMKRNTIAGLILAGVMMSGAVTTLLAQVIYDLTVSPLQSFWQPDQIPRY